MNQFVVMGTVIVTVAIVHWVVRGDVPRQWRLERRIKQSTRRRERQLLEWMVKNRMELDTVRDLSIDGLLVREFGYLLRHVTDGQLDTFKDFEKVHDLYPLIVAGINKDMQDPLEVERNLADLETARANLTNLRRIVDVIARYVEKCRDLHLTDRLALD
ncbi:hypothetical protein KDX16_15720 [Burkholderia vietnamiensis]|uniref:hypothetical protein n=1 Tax=Burkholderia TaxID=32008 RepID=UPI0010F7C607|nr:MULTISPECIES: hypothetical protein [Burkholderia]MBR7917272.1 hypothetical protein [Burkholderia vietnamiensis]MBR8055177.1 hypothetical protein [Burkholderia vietnamiensis]HDR9761533.1 hypothetical protein [Burkholderia cepacia ATCC 25416]HDR9791944.1 hypothetical protein [Burkholderia cepacia ATCC 25416]